MRVSIDRRSFTGSSGSICRTTLCSASPSDSGGRLVRTTTKRLIVGAQGVRIVNRALGRLVGEAGLFHRADDADDGECFAHRLSSSDALEKALAESAAREASSIARSPRPRRRPAPDRRESSAVRNRPSRREKPMAAK